MRRFLYTGKGKLISLCLCLVAILVIRLFVLTVFQHSYWYNLSKNMSIKGIFSPSPRGSIYDRNGILLAGNKHIFTVKMSAGNLDNSTINQSTIRLIGILDKNKDKYIDDFPIKIKNGKFYYTYDEDTKKWLKQEGFALNFTAEEAFNALRSKLGIPMGDRFEIQREMQSKYNQYPPILVRDMIYYSDKDKKQFLESYNLDLKSSARNTFKELRKYFDIDEKYSDEFARKILIIRNALHSLGYRKYLPAEIAKNVSGKTVMVIEEGTDRLPGVEVISETKRYYPKGTMAAHVLGYLGKINSNEVKKYEEKGYSQSAMIGKEGIERACEDILKGQDGTKTVSVDNNGRYVNTLAEIPPKKGKDIYLTIDSKLQEVAEDALKRNINAIRGGGSFKSEFGDIGTSKMAPNARSGAVVALDVKNGDVLAMASYPTFDPNLFSQGITFKEWKNLQSKNPRDSLSPAPLYNIATKSAVQPGSTFKPLTALAALNCGLDPARYLYANGFIKLGNKTFACVVWNMGKHKHGYINLYRALEVSCNYYFYDISTGKDFYTNRSLYFKKKITVDKITALAQQFGLGKSTGIEIPETVIPVPSEERKIAGLKKALSNELYANAERFFIRDVYSNSRRLEKDINTIISWIEIKDIDRQQMYNQLLPEVGIKHSCYEEVSNICLYTYFNQAKWSIGDAFNIGIGQGENSYTPLQMANYVATIGNGGIHNKVSLIHSIEDEGLVKRSRGKRVELDKNEYLQEVLKGMVLVTCGQESHLKGAYKTFPWKVAAKTGTAQRSGRINPVSEVKYIKSHLSSFGNFSWKSVNKEMKRLMKFYPRTYPTEDIAVRRAVINLSKNKITSEKLDAYKGKYDEFAWIIAVAPADKPKIAVAAMIIQGKTSANVNPVVREVIGQYLKKIEPSYKDFKIVNQFN